MSLLSKLLASFITTSQLNADALVLVGLGHKVDASDPMAYEKLCPVLGLYKAKDFDDAVAISSSLVNFGGRGHSANLYTNLRNYDRIKVRFVKLLQG